MEEEIRNERPAQVCPGRRGRADEQGDRIVGRVLGDDVPARRHQGPAPLPRRHGLAVRRAARSPPRSGPGSAHSPPRLSRLGPCSSNRAALRWHLFKRAVLDTAFLPRALQPEDSAGSTGRQRGMMSRPRETVGRLSSSGTGCPERRRRRASSLWRSVRAGLGDRPACRPGWASWADG